jgi:hypothetical protein
MVVELPINITSEKHDKAMKKRCFYFWGGEHNWASNVGGLLAPMFQKYWR